MTLTTAEASGERRRDGMVCSARISSAATTIGSAPLSGIAAWQLLPVRVISNESSDAIIAPGLTASDPTGMPGQLCSA